MIGSPRMDDEIIYSWCFNSVECFDSRSCAAIIALVENLESLSSLRSQHVVAMIHHHMQIVLSPLLHIDPSLQFTTLLNYHHLNHISYLFILIFIIIMKSLLIQIEYKKIITIFIATLLIYALTYLHVLTFLLNVL